MDAQVWARLFVLSVFHTRISKYLHIIISYNSTRIGRYVFFKFFFQIYFIIFFRTDSAHPLNKLAQGRRIIVVIEICANNCRDTA